MQIETLLVDALIANDAKRARSLQKEIGVSQIGGCRRQVFFQKEGFAKTNQTLKLPAIMGTAIHKEIEQAIGDYSVDLFETFEIELEVEHDGLKGHIDLYIPEMEAVIDWKTTKLKNMGYFPYQQQRWQVHLYAWLLEKNGHKVKTVSLTGVARDGDERDIRTHTEAYNPEIAEQALAWYREVMALKEAPAPEKNAEQFCKNYCGYFGELCQGKDLSNTDEVIDDPMLDDLANEYLTIQKAIKELEAKQDAIKASLENVSGKTNSGITIKWTTVKGRESTDEAEIIKVMGFVPKKTGNSYMKLAVKK